MCAFWEDFCYFHVERIFAERIWNIQILFWRLNVIENNILSSDNSVSWQDMGKRRMSICLNDLHLPDEVNKGNLC